MDAFRCVHEESAPTKTYKVAMWMRKFLSPTLKRTWLWSTSPAIRALDRGPLLPSEKTSTVQTTNRSVKNGKKQWCGNKNLKPTQ